MVRQSNQVLGKNAMRLAGKGVRRSFILKSNFLNSSLFWQGSELQNVWQCIPSDTDVLMTHGPPLGIGDRIFIGKR